MWLGLRGEQFRHEIYTEHTCMSGRQPYMYGWTRFSFNGQQALTLTTEQ